MSNFLWGLETESNDKTGKRIELAISIVAMVLVAGCIAATGLMMWQKNLPTKLGGIDSTTELAIFKELRKEHAACHDFKTSALATCGQTNQRFEQLERSMKNWIDSARPVESPKQVTFEKFDELSIFQQTRADKKDCYYGRLIFDCDETNQRFEQIERSMKNWKEAAK